MTTATQQVAPGVSGHAASPPAWVQAWLWVFPGSVRSTTAHKVVYAAIAIALLLVELVLLTMRSVDANAPYVAAAVLMVSLAATGWHAIAGGIYYASMLMAVQLFGIDGGHLALPLVGVFAVVAEWISRSWFVPAGALLFTIECVQFALSDSVVEELEFLLLGGGLAITLGLVARWQHSLNARLRAESAANRDAAVEAGRRVRRELAAELHDTLAKDLARVSITAQRLTTQPHVDTAELHRLAELANTASRRLRPLILGLDAPSSTEALSAVITTCTTMLRSRSIRLDVELPADLDTSRGVRQRNLASLVIREAATNILKYAPAGSVANLMIETLSSGKLSVITTNLIADAPSPAELTGGFGLANLAQRLDAEGGSLDFGPAAGTWLLAATVPADGTGIKP